MVLLPSPGVGPAAAPSLLQVTEVSSTDPRPLRVAGASTELPFSQVGEAGEAPFPLPAGGAGAASRLTSLWASLSPWTRAAGGGALLFPRAGGTAVVPHPLQLGGASAALLPSQVGGAGLAPSPLRTGGASMEPHPLQMGGASAALLPSQVGGTGPAPFPPQTGGACAASLPLKTGEDYTASVPSADWRGLRGASALAGGRDQPCPIPSVDWRDLHGASPLADGRGFCGTPAPTVSGGFYTSGLRGDGDCQCSGTFPSSGGSHFSTVSSCN